jgi:selenide,water dikinase
MSEEIRLTETVQKGGCAAKLPAGQLRDLIGRLGLRKPPELLVGTEHMDDACLYDLGDGRSLVQTLDFFTPIVDDARDFGAIAAANALSDVYAMGGDPKIALSILAFPTKTLPIELLEPLLGGAVEKVHEAGACLAGGHTIDDDTLKFGLSVTGFVRNDRAWTNSGVKAGDSLILTKALGTGTLTSALLSCWKKFPCTPPPTSQVLASRGIPCKWRALAESASFFP